MTKLTTRKWQAALLDAEEKVMGLSRSLRVLKQRMERNEISVADYHRKVADALDAENMRLDQIFAAHQPPLHGDYAEERLSYIRGQTRVRGHLNEVGRTL